MSEYSQQVNYFVSNALLPELNKLNKRLSSMEEFGYASTTLVLTRKRANNLLPVYDFLNEYIYGDEECDWSELSTMISGIGLGVLDKDSIQPLVESPLKTIEDTTVNVAMNEYVVVNIDGEVYDGSLIASGEHTMVLVADTSIDKMVLRYGVTVKESNKAVIKAVRTIVDAGANNYTIELWKDGEQIRTTVITIQAQ